MVDLKKGKVISIIRDDGDVMELAVETGGAPAKAIAYPALTGGVSPGDVVLLNVTAVKLGLGSGGRHFVVANLTYPEKDSGDEPGHIMKLRYTPMQMRVLAAEEEDSPHHDIFVREKSIASAPVAIAGLHSMVAPFCASVSRISSGTARVAYIMTDGACLAAPFSNNIRELRTKKLITSVITCGNAFGGDIETVSKHSALIAARHIAKADIVIAAMGVGIAGTDTATGHTGVEVAEWVNAVTVMGGRPVVIPRMSFADERPRHQGLSHHIRYALDELSLAPAVIPIPSLDDEKNAVVERQIVASTIAQKNDVIRVDSDVVFGAVEQFDLHVSTMGRGIGQEREFFMACGAAAIVTCKMLTQDFSWLPGVTGKE